MKSNNSYAPVGISTYSRVEHLKQTIEALKLNVLAAETDLYIFSDGPTKGDEELVRNLRLYVETIDGFNSVTKVFRDSNSRIANNRGGMKRLADSYGRFIFLEEDVVTSPYFLSYMNDSLDKYESSQNVVSVSAYCPPIDLASLEYGNFFLPRFNGWGFGSWADRFDPFDFDVTPQQCLNLRQTRKEFVDKNVGSDFWKMALSDSVGLIDALDVKVMAHQARTEMLTAYPVKSFSRNIGFDGTGLHCNNTNRFDNSLADSYQESLLSNQPEIDNAVREKFVKFRSARKLVLFLNILRYLALQFLISTK